MKLLYLLIPIIMVFASCSKNEESEVLDMSTHFFDKLEKRQYDSIYVLLSFNDQKNMTKDDFIDFCKGWNFNPYEKEIIADGTITIEKSENNSFTATKKYFATNQEKVRQLKEENESYKEAIKRLAALNLLPIKSDSSFIKIIRENSSLKVDLSLKNFKDYQTIWSEYMDSLNNRISIVPVEISIDKIGTFWIVKAEVNIQNHLSYSVKYLNAEMIYEKQVMGRLDLSPFTNNYRPDSSYFKKTTADLNMMSKLKKYLRNKPFKLDNNKIELKAFAGFPEDFKIIEKEIAKRSSFYAFTMFPMSKF